MDGAGFYFGSLTDGTFFVEKGLDFLALLFNVNLLGGVIEVLSFLPDYYFCAFCLSAQKNAEVSLAGEGNFVCIFIKISKVEVFGEYFEDLWDEGAQLGESLGVGGLQDMNFLVVGDFKKHLRKKIIILVVLWVFERPYWQILITYALSNLI